MRYCNDSRTAVRQRRWLVQKRDRGDGDRDEYEHGEGSVGQMSIQSLRRTVSWGIVIAEKIFRFGL